MGRPAKKPDVRWGEGAVEQRGARIRVRWREHGRKCSKGGFTSQGDALEELERIRARLKLGQPGVVKPIASITTAPATSIPKLVEEWVDYRIKVGKRMALEEKSRWALHLAQPLETQTLKGITAKWVRALATELVKPTVGTKAPDGTRKRPVSGPTAHRVLTLLSSFLSWCCDEGHLTENVARVGLRHKDVKRLLRTTHDPKSAPYLKSCDEVMRLYQALAAPVSMLYLISARAGLRPGEVVALRWDDIDIDANTIYVARQVRAGKEGPTKSGKPRTVPMGDVLAAELAACRGKNVTGAANNDLVCPPPSRKRKNGAIASRMGRYLGPKSINQAMEAAFKATGIAPGTLYEYGRHTFGSLAGLGGISAWRLQEVLGHADIKTTLHYVSLKDHQPLTVDERRALGG